VRFVDRVDSITSEEIAKYAASERRRIAKLPAEYVAQLMAKLDAKSEHELRTEIAKQTRKQLNKRNASAAACGSPPLETQLGRVELEQLVTRIMEADVDSESELNHLVDVLERSVPDPLVRDYIFYPGDHGLKEPSAHEIVDRALAHPARVLAMIVSSVELRDKRDHSHLVELVEPGGRTAFATLVPPRVPDAGDVVAVALVGTVLADGRRVAREFKPGACCVVLGPTDRSAGTDLTGSSGCRAGVWEIGRGWIH
jgi:hypothetical protein